MGKTKRKGNIELLRFIFAVFVVLHHAQFQGICSGGWLGVEFFFIISGYFMTSSIMSKEEKCTFSQALEEAKVYIKKRIIAIYPYFLVSTLFGAIVSTLADELTGVSLKHSLYMLACIPYDLLFLQNYGFPAPSFIGTLWYLSAYFFAIWFLYPLLRMFGRPYLTYFAPIIVLILSGNLMNAYHNLGEPVAFFSGVISSGFMRAVSMMSIGGVLFFFVKYLQEINWQIKAEARRRMQILEVGFWILSISYMVVWKQKIAGLDFVAVICIFLGLSIALQDWNFWVNKLDCDWVRWLGNFSMVLFMNHCYWLFRIATVVSDLGISISDNYVKIIGVLLSFTSSYIVLSLGKRIESNKIIP